MDLKSGYPFWLVKNGLLYNYPPLRYDLRCTVAIIGGGITGALIAYHLVEAGIDTVLLDKRHIGWGSTSATTALLQYEIDVPLVDLIPMVGEDHAVRSYQACLSAIGKIEKLVTTLGDTCDFQRKQSLYLASYKKDIKLLAAELALRRQHGFNLEWLTQQQVESQFGCSRPAALLSADGASVDAYQLTHLLLQKAIKRGLAVFDRTHVTQIEHNARGVKLTTTQGHTVTAHKIVFASGYESQAYLSQPIAKLISTYALVSEPFQPGIERLSDYLVWESAQPYLYLRTTADQRVILGGEDEEFRNPIRRDQLLPYKTKRLQQKFSRLFPQIPLEVAFAWTGTFGETKDGLAYIGEVPERPHAWFALGYGGNGITYSVLSAEIIRDALQNRQHPAADLFRFDR
jgi:glycine/D-amino acid oxidase-like deaminating enzyme